jgi:hypothetical protein
MRRRLSDLVRAYGGPAELAVDAHRYGGGALLALGVGLFHPGAGIAVMGALLVYLGLRSPRRR